MTLLTAPPKPSDPTQGPDRPWPGMPPPSFAIGAPPKPSNPTPADPPKPSQPRPTSVFAMARPDDMPVPTSPAPPPPPTPKPGISLRIGHAPRLPRRERTARLLTQLGRYALAWGVVGWACYWIGDVHLAVPGFAIAAMVANPWRPKRPAHPWSTALRAAFDSLLRRLVVRAGLPSAIYRAT